MPARTGLALMLAAAGAAADGLPQYGAGGQVATLANPQIHESSGLACSRRTPGAFWTHNDSGDQPRLFACDEQGADLGEFPVSAGLRDWEDIASATLHGKALLLIADIGDNHLKRSDYAVHVIEEPVLAKGQRPAPLKATTFAFAYADGKPHNCESLAIDASDGLLYLVTKVSSGPSQLCVVPTPLSGAPQAARYTATPIAELDIGTATAADIDPTGSRLIVLTGRGVLEWHRTAGTPWADAVKSAPRTLKAPRGKQSEALCFGPDGMTLWLTSETGKELPAAPTPLFRLPLATP